MSDVVRKNLGAVTAYKYAVSKGYTGTEEEFAELMASYATVAEEAAESANTAAEQALKSEGNAVGKQNGTDVPSGSPYYHNNAKWYAEQAAGSASSASSSASAASSSAASASGSASTASTKASAASASATTASNKAAEASSSATSAAASASAAGTSETNAAASATAAATSAGNAASSATAAQDAQTATEEVAEDIEEHYGSLVEDVSELKTEVSAIEDISDIGIPLTWKQGGVNSSGGNTASNYRIRCVSVTVGDYASFIVTPQSGYSVKVYFYNNGYKSATDTFTGQKVVEVPDNIETFRMSVYKGDGTSIAENLITPDEGANIQLSYSYKLKDELRNITDKIDENERKFYDSMVTESISGSIASLPDGADDLPVKSLVVGIEPVQPGSGDPSPDNVRPISGWIGANTFVTGKNLCGGEVLRDNIKAHVPSATIDSNAHTITFSAAASVVYNGGIFKNITFKENTQYTFVISYKKSSGAGGSNMRVYYTDGTVVNYPQSDNPSEKTPVIFISAAGKTVDHINKINSSTSTIVYYDESGVFEGVLTVDDFKPYIGTTYPVSWESEAGTVYGGTLDMTNGVLTVDRVGYTVTELTDGWVLRNSGGGSADPYWCVIRNASAAEAIANTPNNGDGNGILSHGMWRYNAPGWRAYYRSSGTYSGTCFVLIGDTETPLDTTEAVNAFIASLSSPLQVVYKIKTPITYQLTPTEVRTLLGENNIFADTGDIVNLEYRADTKLYIDRLTAPDSDMIADANITSGSYFMVNNSLYIATAAIAAGETIVPGTNCTLTNLAAALNALNA